MSGYIEREAAMLLPELPKGHRHYQTDNLDDAYGQGWDDALCCLEHIPAADVTPVRHGRWVSLTDCSNAGVYCSVCQKKVWEEDYAWCNKQNKLRSPFCPHCGAKMDEEEERNE